MTGAKGGAGGEDASSSDTTVRLGDFIENRTGVCRHKAAALQLALQESGIPSRLVFGELKVDFAKDGKPYYGGRHAWVVVSGEGGREYILDPTMKQQGYSGGYFYGPHSDEANTVRTRKLEGRAFSETTIYRYKPDGYGWAEGVEALSRDDFADFLPFATGGVK